MFEKFDINSIKAIMLAQEECRRLCHNFVGTDQILLGIIAENTNLASKIIRSAGVTLKNARIEVFNIIGKGSDIVEKEIPFTPKAKILFKNSVNIALLLEHGNIRPEHLLMGLVIEEEGVGSRVLENLGVSRSYLVRQIFSELASQGDRNAIKWTSKIVAKTSKKSIEANSQNSFDASNTVLRYDFLLTELGSRDLPSSAQSTSASTQSILSHIKLSGQQSKKLKEALIDAFPSAAALEQMLAYELEKSLRVITGEGSLQNIVFDLIQAANAQGWINELICAACITNPGNLKLQDIAKEVLTNSKTGKL